MRPFDLVLRYQSGLKMSTTILIFKCEPEARSPHILPTSPRNHLEDTSFRGEGQSEPSLKATARCACPPAVLGTAPGLRGGGCRASPRAQGAGSVPTARPRIRYIYLFFSTSEISGPQRVFYFTFGERNMFLIKRPCHHQ